MKHWFISFLFFFLSFFSFCQESISFVPRYYTEEIQLNEPIQMGKGRITFHTLKFYVTQFSCKNDNNNVLRTAKTLLVDLEDSTSQKIQLIGSQNKHITYYDWRTKHISFLLGTDSLTNVSGILEGPLDPINGMYWAWNSGYINFKVEGAIQDLTGNTTPFEFHIGGYLPPNATVGDLSFELDLEKQNPLIAIQMDEWLEIAFNKGLYSLMIPGKTAVELANSIQTSFHLFYEND